MDSPARLDAFLASQNKELSRSKLQKLIKAKAVFVNGKAITKQAYQLTPGDEVAVTEGMEKEVVVALTPSDLNLEILYEDELCFVINKPAGYAVHPAPGEKNADTILHGVAFLFEQRFLPFSTESVLVHRLDKETTGCMLIAKSPRAHEELQAQFSDRTIEKTYLAIVAGVPNPPRAVINAPVGRNLTDRTKMSVQKTSVSREAKTTYRTLASTNETALLACDLHTGRTHQIRVHLRAIGHSILGDETYKTPGSENLTQTHHVKGLCLHAWKLTFISPEDKRTHVVEAPLPQLFKDAQSALGLEIANS